jgi:hypothetical protein
MRVPLRRLLAHRRARCPGGHREAEHAGAETALTVVFGGASIGLHDDRGAKARLYPGYGSISFALEPLLRDRHDAEAAAIRGRLSRISSGAISRKEPSASCRDALASWDAACQPIRMIVAHRQ